jgi:pimeloyl-ACP methyl ester carboxylesterase
MSWFSSKPKEGVEVVRPGEQAEQHHVQVDPKWLLKAGVLAVFGAAVCGYLALCLLFYQGQWQLLLHPAPMQTIPKDALPEHEDVHFAMTESGQPTLFGWWIPADKGATWETDTLVFVPSGSGSMSEATARLTNLHLLRANVFVFDYRGYGNSAKLRRPSEQSMNEDAVSALHYLTDTRHIPPSHIVVVADGLGCLPALHAANQTPGVAGAILDNPRMSQRTVFYADPRTALLPLRLLLRDDFSLDAELQMFKAPKLILDSVGTGQGANDAREVYAHANEPKKLLKTPVVPGDGKLFGEMGDFLTEIFPSTSSPAVPGSGSAPSASPEK